MMIPFPSAEDSNGKPERRSGENKTQNSDRRKLFGLLQVYYRGLVLIA
jgi:hypothetical protein